MHFKREGWRNTNSGSRYVIIDESTMNNFEL